MLKSYKLYAYCRACNAIAKQRDEESKKLYQKEQEIIDLDGQLLESIARETKDAYIKHCKDRLDFYKLEEDRKREELEKEKAVFLR